MHAINDLPMVRFCIGLFALLSSAVYAQNAYVFNASNFVVGDGPDTAYLVVDFQSAGAWDPPSSFYWSVAFEDSIQGSSLLAMVDSVDDNLTVDFMGAFVDSISLGTEYVGKNGVNGFYWGIWSDTTGGNRWVSNSGASEWIQPNAYYGLSFTDFAPAIVPDTAVAVNDARDFTISDIEIWSGVGSDSAILVIDFLNTSGMPESFAWGILFDDSVSGNELLQLADQLNPDLQVGIAGGFLNDIVYQGIEGLAGSPNYWNTWSSTTNGYWITNAGLSTVLNNGDWFGCSYPNYPPAIFPRSPKPALVNNIYAYNRSNFIIGSGSDTAYLVVDFQSAGAWDPPSSFYWSVAFDDSIAGFQMVNAVLSADENLNVFDIFGIIDSVSLGEDYTGKSLENNKAWAFFKSSASPNRWTLSSSWTDRVYPNEYYGLSFTDTANLLGPDTAVAINNPSDFTAASLVEWAGSGSDSAILVIDFLNESGNPKSYAWGILFDDSISAEALLQLAEQNYFALAFDVAGGFLNDIIYQSDSGLAGSPYYWNTWSTTTNGYWMTNAGLSTVIKNGDWFGCSYPNYPPAIFPRSPVPWQGVNPGIAVLDASLLKVWPNPSAESIEITCDYPIERIDIARSNGQAVEFEFHNNRIEWRTSWKGMALVMVTLQDGRYVVKPILRS